MKTAVFLLTLILLLSACTPQLAAAPTSTPTPVPSPIATATKTPTETVVPTVSPELNPIDTVASVWEVPNQNQLFEVQQTQNLPNNAEQYKQALVKKFGSNIRVEYATNNQGRWTLVAYGEDGNIIAAYKKDGKKLDEPIYYGPDDNGMAVLDKLKSGLELDYRTIPDSADAVVQWTGRNSDLPVFVKGPVKVGDITIYSMYWDNNLNEWRETQAYIELKAQLEPKYDTTEFTGIYSNKYYPDRFRYSFDYVDELGTVFTIHLGMSSGLPRNAAIPYERGKEYIAGNWLRACFRRYTQLMGNKISLEEYKSLVNKGGGQVEHVFFDELTGEIKQSITDPTKVSVTLVPNDKLPLQANPKTDSFQETYYITANQQGEVILVVGIDPDVIKQVNDSLKRGGATADLIWSNRLMGDYTQSMRYWSGLTQEVLDKGGRLNTKDVEIFELYLHKVYKPEIDKLDFDNVYDTPFMYVQ